MRLNRQSDIAIGILTACARAPGRTIRTAEAAERADASKDSAAQIILLLAREGFLTTTRGRQGGIALAVPAREILLGDVLRRIQPDLVQNACPENGGGSPLNQIVGAAEATFFAFLDRFSVADLASGRTGLPVGKPDCRLTEGPWASRAMDDATAMAP